MVCLSLDFVNKSISFKLFCCCFLPFLRFIRLDSLLDNACTPAQSQMTPEVLCVSQIFNLDLKAIIIWTLCMKGKVEENVCSLTA